VALDSAVSPKSLAVVDYLVLNLVRLHRLKYELDIHLASAEAKETLARSVP
jgi:hypothetical protein